MKIIYYFIGFVIHSNHKLSHEEINIWEILVIMVGNYKNIMTEKMNPQWQMEKRETCEVKFSSKPHVISLSSGLTRKSHTYWHSEVCCVDSSSQIYVSLLFLDMKAPGLSPVCPEFLLCEYSYVNEFLILALMCILGNSEILKHMIMKSVRELYQSQGHFNVSENWKMCPWFQKVLGFLLASS